MALDFHGRKQRMKRKEANGSENVPRSRTSIKPQHYIFILQIRVRDKFCFVALIYTDWKREKHKIQSGRVQTKYF
jgi:hypothetical protein